MQSIQWNPDITMYQGTDRITSLYRVSPYGRAGLARFAHDDSRFRRFTPCEQ